MTACAGPATQDEFTGPPARLASDEDLAADCTPTGSFESRQHVESGPPLFQGPVDTRRLEATARAAARIHPPAGNTIVLRAAHFSAYSYASKGFDLAIAYQAFNCP